METASSIKVSDNAKLPKGRKKAKVATAKKLKSEKTVKKWRQRTKKPIPVTGCSPTPALLTFRLFNSDVEYRVCGTIVMFSTENVLTLTKTSLGLKTDIARSTPVGAVLRHLRTASKYELLLQDQDQSWVRTHISWKAYKDLVNDAVTDIALKEMLNRYVPFESRKVSPTSEDQMDHGPTLEKDCLKLAGVSVPFVVHRGRIFLDLLASFTVLGQLRLAFMNNWEKVDRILEEQGLNQKDAFRRNHKSRAKERKWNSQRSHITFRAVKVLAENGLVEDGGRKRMLAQLFSHLELEISKVVNTKQTLLDQMEAKVKDLVAVGQSVSPETSVVKVDTHHSLLSSGDEDLAGTELCDSGCGRQYHFTIRCCPKSHQVILAGKSIGFIIHKGRIFLEKCGAFSSLGRMYVIRCSDYRRSDKTLASVGLKPKKHYLYESQTNPDQNVHYRRRNRRTHISFEAFSTLVNSGFADQARNKELLEAVQQIHERSEDLKRECLRYSKAKVKTVDSMNNKQDSSSGIETGSSRSGSGTSSPVSFDDEKPPPQAKNILKLQKIKVFGQSINTCMEQEQLFLSVSDVGQCLTDAVKSLQHLKRLSRSLELKFSPAFKKLSGQHFVSVECLSKLLEEEKVSSASDEFKQQIGRLMQSHDDDSGKSQEPDSPDLKQQSSETAIEVEDIKMEENDDDYDESLVTSTSPQTSTLKDENPTVDILGLRVCLRVVNNSVYLEKKSVFKLLNITTPSHIAYRSIDKTLEQAGVCVDDSFLYDGRRRSFMSTKAFRVLFPETDKSPEIYPILDDIEAKKDSFKVNRTLKMSTFNDIAIKLVNGTIFLSTVHFLTAVGFRRSYMSPNPSKAYFVLVRLLKRRGLNCSACFLKWGKSKYAHISVYGAMTLFKTEFGPFRDKCRIGRLRTEILSSLKENGLTYQESSPESEKRKKFSVADDEKFRRDPNYANLGPKFPPIRFQIRDGVTFLHRKSCFEAIGVERALLSSTRGYAAINNILVCGRVDLKQCYIRGKQEQYAYISLQAIFVLLDCEDPLFACLEKKESFVGSLFSWISSKVLTVLTANNQFPLEGLPIDSVPFRSDGHRLHLHRDTCFKLSGLYEKRAAVGTTFDVTVPQISDEAIELAMMESPTGMICALGIDLNKVGFLPDGEDPYGFISADTLLLLTRLDGEITRASNYHKLIWKDMIHAVLHEVPKLKIHVKMLEFRESVLASLVSLLKSSLEYQLSGQVDLVKSETGVAESNAALPKVLPSTSRQTKEEAADSSLETEREDDDPMEDDSLNNSSEDDPLFVPSSASSSAVLTRSDFEEVFNQVYGQPTIGDWTIRSCSDSEICLYVNPGYGASKKPSFTQPDVWAILSYELKLKPESTPELIINGHRVPHCGLRPIFSKAIKKGVFNLLYTLLTLRPCFGCFNPELVETFENEKFSELTVDSNFIGSSQSGRTYAGCVRSKRCYVLAESRVSDTCVKCKHLRHIAINRSVLSSPEYQSSSSGSGQQTQLSVWKVEESSVDGCTFLCLQLQSFNTSLPHQFKTSQQATSVVSHRVHISNDLQIKISLNGTNINSKIYPGDFATNKQVGPLLDWAASLRLCIGYPDAVLVERARYLDRKKQLLPPETRKFFDYILVDPIFEWKKMNSSEKCLTEKSSSNVGTLRTPSCRYVAGDDADICDQCRLLQEPLEFLGVKKS